MLGYCYAATTHRHVIMTDANDAVSGKMLFKLVEEFHIGGQAIYYYAGSRVGSHQTDVLARAHAFRPSFRAGGL